MRWYIISELGVRGGGRLIARGAVFSAVIMGSLGLRMNEFGRK